MGKFLNVLFPILIGLFCLSAMAGLGGLVLLIWDVQPGLMDKVVGTAFCLTVFFGVSSAGVLLAKD